MTRTTLLSIVLMLPVAAEARAQDATTLAKEILKKGAARFDEHDASAMAATYVEDARLTIVSKDKETGEFRASVSKEGRAEIEGFYRDIFKDAEPKTKSRNNVEFAHLVGDELLIIHGTFLPDDSREDRKVTFVQERVKQGDRWLIFSMRLYLTPE